MKKTHVIFLILLCALTSVFAEFKFTGGAKIVWSYDFNESKFTSSGREGSASLNMTVRATGDFYSIVLQGPLYSRSTTEEGMKGRITLKAIKLLEEFDIKFDKIKSLDIYAGNSIIRSNHAYADPLKHDDGSMQLLIATNSRFFPYGAEIGIDDFTIKFGMTINSEHQEYGFNVKGKFLDGAVEAEAGYAFNNDKEFKKEKVDGNEYRYGHKFEDGDNGHRVGTSFKVDVAKLANKDDLSVILSADVQLNLGYKEANAYYAAAVVKYQNWFGGVEYKYIPKTIDEWKVDNVVKHAKIEHARISAVEGKVQYTFDTKHSPVVFATAGYMFDRHDLESDYKDKGFLLGVGASIKVKEMTVKAEYKYSTYEWSKFYGQSKVNFEINFSF